MNRRNVVNQSLADCVRRLDAVFRPWDFEFVPDRDGWSHYGLFASGRYVRGTTRIWICCRDTLDNIEYEHSFFTKHQSWQSVEHFGLGHDSLMEALGHRDDCHLIGSWDIPDVVVARDGGDRVTALLHDLSAYAALVLREPSEVFDAIMRQGSRYYSVSC
jgi:hypothetical protein